MSSKIENLFLNDLHFCPRPEMLEVVDVLKLVHLCWVFVCVCSGVVVAVE